MNVHALIHAPATIAPGPVRVAPYCAAAKMTPCLRSANEIAGELATENTAHARTCGKVCGSWQLIRASAPTNREKST